MKTVYPVPVRALVEFVLRRGDLSGSETDFVGPGRALAGTRGHQRLQSSRPAGYQKEVRLSHDLQDRDFILRIQGRIDGVLVTDDKVLLEEIKTVQGAWDGAPDPLHWAQAKIYAHIYAAQNGCPAITVQLSYLNLESGEEAVFHENFSAAALTAFFGETTAHYLEWMRDWHEWRWQRDESLAALKFPFAQYRPGQREMAKAVYRSLASGGRLFLEAPTGIGKTLSVLFPALKALGEGKVDRLFYLTGRTVGRTVAESALRELRVAGARLRSLTLTAREKLCVQNGSPCDRSACPRALGYYDRYKAAMRETLRREDLGGSVLEEVSAAHQVCPHALSHHLVRWVDIVVGDYNYVFDPKVYLRGEFEDNPGDYGLLVDEAHNLVDRAREMFSSELATHEVREVWRACKTGARACARKLRRLCRVLQAVCGETDSDADETRSAEEGAPLQLCWAANPAQAPAGQGLGGARDWFGAARNAVAENQHSAGRPERSRSDLPPELLPAVEEALLEAERWLARNEPSEFREDLLELYFKLSSFRRTAQLFDECYATIVEPGKVSRVRLFCVDPSALLGQALKRGKAAVFFSATLSPPEYYRTLLGGQEGDPALQLPSPFPTRNLTVMVEDRIRTQLKSRSESLNEVVQALAALVRGRRGNYLIYFPSYQYLAEARERFQARYPETPVLAQRPGLSEMEREAFLSAFSTETEQTLVGFAVLGGLFAEGIDLAGERLIGAAVVGVGLPQICLERDLIRQHFEARLGAGFEYAYVFPGMNRVVQASGRVIRSEHDRGVVLLIDSRFGEPRYRRLFPDWWQPTRARSAEAIAAAVARFWSAE